MNPARQAAIDSNIDKQKRRIVSELFAPCKSIEEHVYTVSCITQELMRVMHMVIAKNLPSQEAKASYKIGLDSVLLDYGMSVNIHEFNQ